MGPRPCLETATMDAPLSRKTSTAIAAAAPRRTPRALPAIQAGLFAGAIALLLLQFAGIVIYDESPWNLMRLFAALARGPAALEPEDEFDAGLVALGAF